MNEWMNAGDEMTRVIWKLIKDKVIDSVTVTVTLRV